MKVCKTRDAILAYRDSHPGATVREIQVACAISSPSVVQHHLTRAKYDKYDRVALERENAELRRELGELRGKLFKLGELVRMGVGLRP